MADPFVGEIRMCGFNFAPRNWAMCDGATLPVSQNQMLFSLLFTQFGGDGITNFSLPDMRGRTPVHPGNSHDSMVRQGDRYGFEEIPLHMQNMPTHTHIVRGNENPADSKTAESCYPGTPAIDQGSIYGEGTNLTPMSSGAVSSTGGSEAHYNMQPSLVINFIIALDGLYPSRS